MKNICKFLLLIILVVSLTACKKEEPTNTNIQKRQVSYKGIHTLYCTGVSKEKKTKTTMKSTIKYDYDKKELIEGTVEVSLAFQKKLTSEDKSNLGDLSFCSSDMMGNLVAFGECATDVTDKELTSTLTMNKELLPVGYTLDNMIVDLEKIQNIESTCTIK